MNRKFKLTIFTLILVVGAFFMVSCGEKEEDKNVEFDLCNNTSMTVETLSLVDAEDPEDVEEVLADVKTKESKKFVLDEDDSKGKYLLQIKFNDNDFVYTSEEASFDGITKIELSEKDDKVLLDIYKGDEKTNVLLEQPTVESEEVAPEPEETVPESTVTQVPEEPAPEAPAAPANPQPSAPAEPPAEAPAEKPQQDGCLNNALFN